MKSIVSSLQLQLITCYPNVGSRRPQIHISTIPLCLERRVSSPVLCDCSFSPISETCQRTIER
ncbi:hypothetical protein H5410_005392 [Solanum commersonii]|uniref:Uncharacterized protein n=1 Tax=Solanum commersonii TaxID=4109 RepID=A0A9J6A6A5_SOLCO|nr:hypothetical protein H5410_005392 [Solanum commersonii]